MLATLRNPPYFDLTPKSEPGQYHGFFWFYFLNEHVFRFLNMRYPRDYNTVPRYLFWLFHLLWLFPWSVFLPGIAEAFLQTGRSRRTNATSAAVLGGIRADLLHVLHDAGVLLDAGLSCARAAARVRDGSIRRVERGQDSEVIAVIAGVAASAIAAILWHVRGLPTPGDISKPYAASRCVHAFARPHGRSYAWSRLRTCERR